MKRLFKYLVLLLTMFVAAQAVSADDVWNFDASTGHLTVYKDVNYDYDLFYYWHEYRGQIKSIEFGSKVTKIGKYAFRDCTSLTSVIIPKGVTSIGQYAFEGCSALADVTIPQSVTSIGKGAIRLCPSLTSIIIPNSVTNIDEFTFYGCSSLMSVTIPEGVTSIGGRAFQNCSSLTSITIPESVTSIGERAFYGCENLKTVHNLSSLGMSKGSDIHGYVAYYADVLNDGWYFDGRRLTVTKNYDLDSETEYPWYSFRSSIQSVRLGANVTTIGKYAFHDCTSLTSVIIPNSVTSIGKIAFHYCTSLTSVIIPNSVTSIGKYAFIGCSSLTSITIPESVTSIGNGTFFGCSSLMKITIPESVTSIGESAFYGCENLKTVHNLSSLDIVKGAYTHGGVAYYADKVLTKGVYFDYKSLYFLQKDDKYALSVTVLPEMTVTWSSSDANVATVDQNGNVTAVGEGTATITATAGYYYATCKVIVTIPFIPVNGITLSQNAASLFVYEGGMTLSAEVTPEDATDKTVTWSSSDASVATVDQRGNVTAVGAGTATITATAGDCSATCKVIVTIPFIPVNGITLNQKIASLFVDEGMTLSAEVTLEDATDKTVTWSSSDVNVATVDQRGNVTAVGAGTATITATVGDYSATCKVIVTKQVSLVTLTEGVYYMKNVGAGLFLTGGNAWGTYGTFSENGFDVTVTMLPSGKFVIDTKVDNLGNHYLGADGFIDAPQAEWTIEPQTDGTYTITNDGVNYIGYDGSTTVLNLHLTNSSEDNAHWQFMTYEEVMAEICTATKDNPKIVTMLIPGASFNKNDTRNGLWSDAPTVGGYLTDVATNMCGEKWNTPSFDVAQTLTNVPNGYYKVSMQGFYRMGGDASKNDATIAAENHAAGTETLNAIFYANNEEKPLMSIIEGAQAEMFAYGQALNTSYGYVPQNIGAAAATFTDGKYEHSLWVVVTDGTLRVGVKKDAESVNDWTIFDNFRIVYYGNHASGISIDRASMKLLMGESMTLSAKVTPEDATDAVTWSSSDASVATVDQNGNVTAVGVGTATITATAGDCSATCEVTVTIPVIPVSGITLSQNAASLFVYEAMTLSAEVTPEDATDKTVTWSSSDASVATVDQNGNVTAVGEGTAAITATAGDYSATCEVTVTKQVSLVTLTDGVYYMKNVGAGLFLTGGNAWGTQGTFSENGFDVIVTALPSGKYVIDTKVDNWGNHYLGADGFIDAPQAEWTIEPQTDGTYAITNDGVNYIGYDGSTTVLNLHLTNSSEDNARWQFMTYEEVMAEISTATKDNPKTVTMLLPGAAFNQGDTRIGLWSDEPAVGGYQTEFASNKCGEKYSTPSFDVAQTLINVPNGYYKVSMQGFYRMGGDENVYDASLAEAHHKDGTETLNAIFYANNEEKRLMSIIEGAQAEEFAYGGAFYTAYGNVPQDMDAAAAAFTDGKYEHSLWVEVTDGTLRVGVKKDAESVRDWTIFDNFRVVYYGIQQPDAIEEATAIVTFQTNDVYDLSGRLVRRQAESLDGLKPGVYIVNGKKYMVK